MSIAVPTKSGPAGRRLLASLLLTVAGVALALVAAGMTESSLGARGGLPRRVTGAVGTVLVLLTFLYSLRKRRVFRRGSLKQWLVVHELFGIIGPLILVVHGGLRLRTPVAVVAEALVVLIMFSGVVGHCLHRGVTAKLDDLRVELQRAGLSGRELDDRLRLAAGVSEVLSLWRVIHYPLTAAFHAAAIFHVLAILYYGGALP